MAISHLLQFPGAHAGGDDVATTVPRSSPRRKEISGAAGRASSRKASWLAASLLIAAGLTGCVGSRSGAPTAAVPGATTTCPPKPVTLADARHCPVTRPSPVGPKGVSPDKFSGWGASFDNGKLWVGGLWPGGVIDATGFVDADGAVGFPTEGCWEVTGKVGTTTLAFVALVVTPAG